jgi:tetratricopeptide (TPR) repeat protein
MSLIKRILFFGCLTLISAFILSCQSKNKSEAAEFFERGNYHFKKREYERAIQLFSEAIGKVPDFSDAYNNRGLCYEQMGNPGKAISDYQKAVDLDDSFLQAKLNLSRALIHSGETEQSGKVLLQLETAYKDSAAFYDYRGQWNLLRNKMDAAITDFDRAIILGQENEETLTNLGFAFYQKGELKNAENYFMKALNKKPDFGFALNNLSATYGRLNEWEKALSYSSKAVSGNPTELSFLNTHTLNLLENGEIKKAAESLEKSLKLNPESPYSLRNKSILLIKNEQKDAAVEILKKIERTNPDVEFLYYYLGKAVANEQEACNFFKRGKALGDTRCEQESKGC